MATAIFGIVTTNISMSISKAMEAAFDEIEYRLAKRALRHAGKSGSQRAAPGGSFVGNERVMKSAV